MRVQRLAADRGPMLTADSPRITITLELDDDALRVTAVLEALGFQVTRVMPGAAATERRAYAVKLLGSRNRLTGYETKALDGMLAYLEGQALADHMHIGKAAANFASHGVLSKLGASSLAEVVTIADKAVSS